jgi:hypothetical protein
MTSVARHRARKTRSRFTPSGVLLPNEPDGKRKVLYPGIASFESRWTGTPLTPPSRVKVARILMTSEDSAEICPNRGGSRLEDN